jgi:putative ABC transport system permease protein
LFSGLVILSIFIASPLAWLAMDKWLSAFDYRITISIWIFIGAGLIAVIIAMLTVSFQAIKAAVVNPVKSLRAE